MDAFDLLDPRAQPLVRQLLDHGAPPPTIGYELPTGNGSMLEAAWVDANAGIVLDEDDERDAWLCEQRWWFLPVQTCTVDDVLNALAASEAEAAPAPPQRADGAITGMALEPPAQLLTRLKIGREEYCQRLLTMLILLTPYPPWNTRSRPSAPGLAFLRELHQLAFGGPWPGDDLWFVDEFELPPRHPGERGGAPDHAVLWPDRLWLIELKTEAASHRPDQIPSHFRLAHHHHHPAAKVDLLYLTPPMSAPYRTGADWERYAQLTWAEVTAPIRQQWPTGTAEGEREAVAALLAAIDALHLRPADWRRTIGAAAPAAERFADTTAPAAQPPRSSALVPIPAATRSASPAPHERLAHALAVAELTATDGRQRGIDVDIADVDDLLTLRLAVRERLAALPDDSPLRHVAPWIWRPSSTGRPLTRAGDEHGMELRLSRYARSPYRK